MADFDPLDRMSRNLRGVPDQPPRSPMGSMANDLRQMGNAPPSQAPQPGPGNPGMANPEARAAYDDMARQRAASAAPPAAAPTAASAGPAAPVTPSPAAQPVTWGQKLRDFGSGVANTALHLGAGAAGYGVAAGLRNAGNDAGPSVAPGTVMGSQLANQIPGGGTGPTPGAQPYNFWTDSETGRNLGNAANALAPLGGVVSAVKNLPKVASVADAALGGLAAGVRTQRENAPPVQTPAEPAPRGPSAIPPAQTAQPPNPGAQPPNPGAQPPNPGTQPPNPGTQGPTTTNDVRRNGNEYSGGNIAGDITINGRAPGGGGISPQNMAAADALAQRDALRSTGAAVAAGAQGGGVPMATAPTVLHSGNSWQARNDLRNLGVSASSITNNGGRFDRTRGNNPAAQAYQAALKQDLAMRSAQPGLDLEMAKSNNSLRSDIFKAQTGADASRYAADQVLRGDMFKALGAERTAARQAQRDAAAAASAERKYTTERRDRGLERLDKVFETAATRDGKVDAQHLAAMRNGAQAFLGTAVEAARKRGDTTTVQQLESQGLGALAEDPQLMRRYMAALSADRTARGGWMPGENYVGTDNPGGRTVVGVDKGTFVDTVRLSDGTTMNANRLRYRDGGPLSGLNPWAEPTTEFDSIDPKGYLRRPQQ